MVLYFGVPTFDAMGKSHLPTFDTLWNVRRRGVGDSPPLDPNKDYINCNYVRN